MVKMEKCCPIINLIGHRGADIPVFLRRAPSVWIDLEHLEQKKRPITEKEIPMDCPECDTKTCVRKTFDKGKEVVRRRQCPECYYSFETTESHEVNQLAMRIENATYTLHELQTLLEKSLVVLRTSRQYLEGN